MYKQTKGVSVVAGTHHNANYICLNCYRILKFIYTVCSSCLRELKSDIVLSGFKNAATLVLIGCF